MNFGMSQSPECDMCGSLNGLSCVQLTEEPLDADEAYEPKDLSLLCRDHWMKLVESDSLFVRTIPPVSSESGNFSRTTDEKGDILYDGDTSEHCWIRFNPNNSEVSVGKQPESTNES